MTFSTFFYTHKCPTMDNKCSGCSDRSRQDEATFLVMWPSEPSQPPASSSQTLLLTGQGAEFTSQRCPHSPLAAVPHAPVTRVNSNSTIKSTLWCVLTTFPGFSSHLRTHSIPCVLVYVLVELHAQPWLLQPVLLCFGSSFLTGWGELRSPGLWLLHLCVPRAWRITWHVGLGG